MNKLIVLAIGLSAALAGSALADKSSKADKTTQNDKTAKGTKPAKMTCEDFLALEDVQRPKLVYWAEGFNRKGKADEAVVDVDATDQLVPVLVEDCKKD